MPRIISRNHKNFNYHHRKRHYHFNDHRCPSPPSKYQGAFSSPNTSSSSSIRTVEDEGETTSFWTSIPVGQLSSAEEEALLEREQERTKMAAILELDTVSMEGEKLLGYSNFTSGADQSNAETDSSSDSISVKVFTPNADNYYHSMNNGTFHFLDEEEIEEEKTPPERTLHITNLVAPFFVQALKGHLEAFGPLVANRFWITRTQCYVQYVSLDSAIRARRSLHRRRWPPNSPRVLKVEFVDEKKNPSCWRLSPMQRNVRIPRGRQWTQLRR